MIENQIVLSAEFVCFFIQLCPELLAELTDPQTLGLSICQSGALTAELKHPNFLSSLGSMYYVKASTW